MLRKCTNVVPLALVGFATVAALAYPGPLSVPGFTITDYATNLGGGPVQMSFATDGTLYVGHERNFFGGTADEPARIFQIAPGGSPVQFYGNNPIQDADAVLWDGLGSYTGVPGAVLVGGSSPVFGAGQISAIDPNTQNVSVVFGPWAGMENPNAMTFDSLNRLIVMDDDGQVFRVQGNTATMLYDAGPIGGGAALSPDGTSFYARYQNTIRVYDLDGNLINPAFVTGRSIGRMVFGPGGPIWGTDLYGLDNNTGALVRIDSLGNVTDIGSNFGTGPAAWGGDGRIPAALAFGPDGALYHTILNEARIVRIIPEPATLSLLGLVGVALLRRR